MKQYRPHILVAGLCWQSSCRDGWHGALRNALTDLRFGWVSRQATGEIVVVAIDALDRENRSLAMAAPAPRRPAAAAGKRRCSGHRIRRRFQHAVRRGVRPGICRSASKRGRIRGAAVVQAARRRRTTYFNRPLPQFREHAWSAVVNVAVEPDGLVRRYPFGERLDRKFCPRWARYWRGNMTRSARRS